MAQLNPFTLQGNTVTFTANIGGSVPAPVQATGFNNQGVQNYIIYNQGTNDVFVSIAATSLAATAGAVVPSAGTPTPVLVVPAKGWVSCGGPPNAFFTGITQSGTSAVFVSPGEGS